MSLSTTETIGFGNQFVQLIQENKTELQTKGLDVTSWITEGAAQVSDAVTNDAIQDDMSAALKAQTQKTRTAVKTLYKITSTRLDAVIGVLGKDTPIAKQAARLRSSLIKQSKNKKTGNPKPKNP